MQTTSKTQIGQTTGQRIFPIHKTSRKKVGLVQKKDERTHDGLRLKKDELGLKKDERRQDVQMRTDGLLDFRMQTIREFTLSAAPWFELIKDGKPVTGPVPDSVTEPLRQWLGALCDSPQILHHERGDLGTAEMNFLNYGPAVMRAMEKKPGERKTIEAGSRPRPSREEIELAKSAAFTIDTRRRIYRLNDLEDKISKQTYNQLHPDGPEPKSAELIYSVSLALQQHAMLLDGAERRALLNWLNSAEKMLGDIYAYGEERVSASAHATRMKKQLVMH